MSTTFEKLPNEIIIDVFSYIPWYDMLISFWSLNKRLDSLVCSTLSNNGNSLNSGIIISNSLSYKKCSTILFPLILNSSSLCASIERIHLDGKHSNAFDLLSEWLFTEKNILRFSNLKSVFITQCQSIRSIIGNLSYLIQYQLDNLTLMFRNLELWNISRSGYNMQMYRQTGK